MHLSQTLNSNPTPQSRSLHPALVPTFGRDAPQNPIAQTSDTMCFALDRFFFGNCVVKPEIDSTCRVDSTLLLNSNPKPQP